MLKQVRRKSNARAFPAIERAIREEQRDGSADRGKDEKIAHAGHNERLYRERKRAGAGAPALG
jgi:hypothetical protein